MRMLLQGELIEWELRGFRLARKITWRPLAILAAWRQKKHLRAAGAYGDRLFALLSIGIWAVACHSPPPPSRFPTAELAIQRMRDGQSCSRGVSGEARLDYFGDGGRVRGSVLYLATKPERVRFDVFSPFGAILSTLTSDGSRFALYDLKERTFLYGPANACNLQRFTRVPLAPHAFVDLLRGVAPVLVHAPSDASLEWERGAYTLRIAGRHQAEQQIRLAPAQADWNLPWQQQRVRVQEVVVRQGGATLYRVELQDHRPVRTAPVLIDPDGLDPPLPPSGPSCRAELPHRLHFVVESGRHDVVLASSSLVHNPPLYSTEFVQEPPAGAKARYSACPD